MDSVDALDQDRIIRYLTDTFTGLELLRPTDGPGAGDTFVYYDPNHDLDLNRSFPFATIVTKDYGEFDSASRLDRPGVYRLNIGVSRDTFRARCGYAPGETPPEGTVWDYAALDRVMPHPVYAPQGFVCVLNPSPRTFEAVKPLLAEACASAAQRYPSRHIKPD